MRHSPAAWRSRGRLDDRRARRGCGTASALLELTGFKAAARLLLGELYLQGAQLTAWQLPNERPVLFTSPRSAFAPGRAIRGGIPIIFPWFGPGRYGPAGPQHGFALIAMWHLDGVETAGSESLTLTLSLGDGDVSS